MLKLSSSGCDPNRTSAAIPISGFPSMRAIPEVNWRAEQAYHHVRSSSVDRRRRHPARGVRPPAEEIATCRRCHHVSRARRVVGGGNRLCGDNRQGLADRRRASSLVWPHSQGGTSEEKSICCDGMPPQTQTYLAKSLLRVPGGQKMEHGSATTKATNTDETKPNRKRLISFAANHSGMWPRCTNPK